MVSNRLAKVTKSIAKKKGKNPNLHEGSRDTQRLQAASARDNKLNRLTSLREKQNRHYCMFWHSSYPNIAFH
jgi:translation machinery-associated protein 16